MRTALLTPQCTTQSSHALPSDSENCKNWIGRSVTLLEHHRNHLASSGVAPDVIEERKYYSLHRGSDTTDAPANLELLKRLGVPRCGRDAPARLPGLVLPMYRPNGEYAGAQYRPDNPNRDPSTGKTRKYLNPVGKPPVLDVHPRNTRHMTDPTVALWVTEGVKKADSLTSRGACAVSLSGVFGWRSSSGTLGDWEDVMLKGRRVVICFDCDAHTNPNVTRAMHRLGKWLKSKGAVPVYVVTPSEFAGVATKGADDYFVAGGTLAQLESVGSSKPPLLPTQLTRHSDSHLADEVSDNVLDGRACWNQQFGWMAWDGARWERCSDASVVEEIRQYALRRFGELAEEARAGSPDTEAIDGWRKMLDAGRLRSVHGLTRGPREVRWQRFDAEPLAVNTPGGIVDLESGQLGVTDPEAYHTKSTSVAPGDDGRQMWDDFLTQILPDPAVRGFVQRLIGLSLLGEVREHVLPVFIGAGANGKGTFRDAVMHALGDYAVEVDPEMLMESKNARHGTFLMRLRGARLAFCSETDEGRRFAASTMKRLTGGDPIEANYMHSDAVQFYPSHTLIMMTNALPRVSADDEAVWRRLLKVPFDVVIPAGEQDPELPAKLRACAPAVLSWALEGWREYQARGLAAPAAVRTATAAYRAENDHLGQFLSERCCLGERNSVPGGELLAAYLAWGRDQGEHFEVSAVSFADQLSKRGFDKRRGRSGVRYVGLRLWDAEIDMIGANQAV